MKSSSVLRLRLATTRPLRDFSGTRTLHLVQKICHATCVSYKLSENLIHVQFLICQAPCFIQIFKEPLEKEPRGRSIISAEDIKTIFGRLPGILEVHNKIMVRYPSTAAQFKDRLQFKGNETKFQQNSSIKNDRRVQEAKLTGHIYKVLFREKSRERSTRSERETNIFVIW